MSGYWKDRKVLVTGGAGFLGSHLVEMLKEQGASVEVPRRREFDLRYPEDVADMMDKVGEVDTLFHLAANVGGIGYNRIHPATLLEDNAYIGLNVLNAADWAGVRKVVAVGTTCSYPERPNWCMECGEYECDWTGFEEWTLFGGYPEPTNAPYGIAKRLLVVYAHALRKERGKDMVVAIPTNLYGPRDEFDPSRSHVIPALIRKFCHGDATVWGSGQATRDFLYVEDAARGLVALAEADTSNLGHDHYGDCIFNFGSGRETSIREVAALISGIVGLDAELEWDPSKPDGQPRRLLDCSTARLFLDWEPQVKLEDGLRRTVEWYQKEMEEALA